MTWSLFLFLFGCFLLKTYNCYKLPALIFACWRIITYWTGGDIVVASIHWGPNWGYRIPPKRHSFAHRLIDEAGVDLIYGHSSHHPIGMEVYKERLIIYGCGDFINDYEGIGGQESYRPELFLMYFPSLDPATGELLELTMAPMQIRRFQLHRASDEQAEWPADRLSEKRAGLGTSTEKAKDGFLKLKSVSRQ